MSVSLQLAVSLSDVEGDLFEISKVLGGDDVPLLNVIVIPDILSSTQKWSVPGQINWVLTLMSEQSSNIQVFDFRYRLPRRFQWSALADLGNTLVNCIIRMPLKYHFRDIPIIVVSHGLGGMVIKRALSIFDDNYYNPSCQGLLDLFSCLVFLGTPHPIYKIGTPAEQLDMVLSATLKRTSKEILSTIREEVAFSWNISSKFEDIKFSYPVISAYESKPTKVSTGLFRTKMEVIVDESLCVTRMQSEKIVRVDADHGDICIVQKDSPLYNQILQGVRESEGFAHRLSAATSLTGSLHGAEDWQSTIASQLEIVKVSIDQTSGAMATNGSSNNPATIGAMDTKDNALSTAPAVKLPCYILDKYSKTSSHFGRSDILKTLDDVLLPDKQVHMSSRPCELSTFAICGLGGLGKTQLASEFANSRHQHFDAVFFVSADGENKLSEGFNEIATGLGLSDPADSDNKAVNRDKVLQWLNQPTKRPRDREWEDEPTSTEENATYLLVFDNADSPEILTEFWPVTGSGSVLITSRDPHAKSQFYASKGIDLETLSPDDGAELLQARTGMFAPGDKEKARQVAERLGGLPLALVQVAGLLQRRKLTFEEFLEFYNEPSFLAEVHQSSERGVHSNYEYMLFNVWCFEELRPDALRLLEVCSILDPDHITEAIFTSGGTVMFDDLPTTQLALETARSELLKYSLLKRYPEEKELVVHRVLQDATRARMEADHLAKIFASAVNLILAAWPTQHLTFSVETRHWLLNSSLLPHVQKLRGLQISIGTVSEGSDVAMGFANLMVKAAWFECERGNWEDVLPYCDTANSICSKYPQLSAPTRAALDHHYTYVSSYVSNPDVKQFHAQRMLDYHLVHNDKTDNGWLFLGIAYKELSMYHVEMEDFQEGVKLAELSLDAFDNCTYYANKSQMPIWPRLAAGWAYMGLLMLEKADNMILPCVEWIESSDFQRDFNPSRTGASLYALGNLRQAQGRQEEGFELHERALSYYRQKIGQTHFDTAKTAMKMAEHHLRKGRPDDALNHIDNALEAWSTRQIFEGNRARAHFHQAKILQAQGNELKAKGLLLKAEKMKKNWLKDHILMGKSNFNDEYDRLVPCWAR